MGKSRTKHQVVQQTVHAAPVGESGWSFAALLSAFTASLQMWMRKLRLNDVDAEDAMQEARIEVWQRASTFPVGHDEARLELFRLAAKVAQRCRRQATRLLYVDKYELTDPRDIEAWIASRMLWFEALYRLDEPTRNLIIARHVHGRTYKDIGAEMGKEEETARQRVMVAEKKMQAEVDKLTGDDKKGKRGGVVMGIGFALDPFDRAVFRAMLDVEEEFGLAPPPASTVRPKVETKPWPWQVFPMGILALALFLVPGQGWRSEALHAEKIGSIRLPRVEIRAAIRTPEENRLPPKPPLPPKTIIPVFTTAPVLSDKDADIVKGLYQAHGALGGQ